jgi:hypothetical protein
VTRASHASVGKAAVLRQQLTLVAVEMARDHPAFGVGIGRFRAISRFYVPDDYEELKQFAPRGQNAHNNFLQVLGELGIPGLAAFLWLVLPAVRRWRWDPATASDPVVYASAMAAGLATFLVSALFGHPLLVIQVAAAFFLALGVTSAILPAPPASPTKQGVGQVVMWVSIVAIVATLPWRIVDAREFARDEEGLGTVVGTMDDVPFRMAEPVATWRIPWDAAVITLPLRWASPAPAECRVEVRFDGPRTCVRSSCTSPIRVAS